jgi:hydroxymethylpyrimidine pyrophosphatase-like HAD family hydrolase
MLFCALASDYDGTLARDGGVDASTLEALRRFKATGKRLILITGRELGDLRRIFEPLQAFDAVVAENGALLYLPATQEERALAAPPPERLVASLRAKGVTPLSVGRSILATWTPNETVVLETIRELGLDWQLTFNKGAVMCLPPGVNKASGLAAAVAELKLSAHNVVGIGDAENDQAFLAACGCSVAVANALESVKENADLCTRADRGAGVVELIDRWLEDPGATFADIRRHDLYLGDARASGKAVALPSDKGAVLITGSSGVGKTSLTHLLIERIVQGAYQFCVVDPEGDYDNLDGVAHLGDAKAAPRPEEVMSVLATPDASVVVKLLSLDVPERPAYFGKLLGQISGLRAATGRPHWLILDETHHLSPSTQDVQHNALSSEISSAVFITTHPRHLSASALAMVRTLIVVGPTAPQVLEDFCRAVGISVPPLPPELEADTVLAWDRFLDAPPEAVTVGKAKNAHQRHTRKYAEGQLGEDKSFYFRGAAGALNLRAFNLATFLQLAQGVDDDTWQFHLQRGDYARWFRDAIKDDQLAAEAQAAQATPDAAASRAEIAAAIKRRYAPALAS